MTRKDFELIAAAVKSVWLSHEPSRTTIANSLASALATTNPAFNRARFLTACGVEE